MSTTSPTPAIGAANASDAFQAIASYGLLADCNSAALVDRDGSVGWLCLPRYDSPAVFAQILDPAGGHWRIRPTGRSTFPDCRSRTDAVLFPSIRRSPASGMSACTFTSAPL